MDKETQLKNAQISKIDDYSISVTVQPPVPEPVVQVYQRVDLEAKMVELQAKLDNSQARRAKENATYDEEDATYTNELAETQSLIDLCEAQGVIVKPEPIIEPAPIEEPIEPDPEEIIKDPELPVNLTEDELPNP